MASLSSELGPQYAGDDVFKRSARLHQSRYRVEQLRLKQFKEYGNRLCAADALAGKNFYAWPGLLEAVTQRFGVGDKKLCFDMLGSDHIPFNFFVPLRQHGAAAALISDWVGADVAEIDAIEIEWAPEPKSDFLDDNTSFDVYISYRAREGWLGAVGVEVKFTEREYSWGEPERARMLDPRSTYCRVHEASRLYRPDSLGRLRTRQLKQLWRNQLLGAALLARDELRLQRFTSVLLYPSGNLYFGEAIRAYEQQLLPTNAAPAFRGETFERFIAHFAHHARSPAEVAWADYLKQRYIVA